MKHLCFYPNRHVVAGRALKIEDLPSCYQDIHEFIKLLDEPVFKYHDDEYDLVIGRDGLIQVCSFIIENEHPKDNSKQFNISVNWESKWEKYLSLINAFHVFIYSSVLNKWGGDLIDFYEVTRHDVFIKDSLTPNLSFGRACNNGNSKYQLYRNVFGAGHPLLTADVGLADEIISEAVNELLIIKNKPDAITLLSELAKSFAEFKQFNYTTSLVLSWFGIEKLINKNWLLLRKSIDFSTFEEDIKLANSTNKGVVRFKQYSVYNMLIALNIAGRLTDEELGNLDVCRKSRNKIVHSDGESVDKSIAKLSNKVLINLINKEFNLNVNLSFSYSTISI